MKKRNRNRIKIIKIKNKKKIRQKKKKHLFKNIIKNKKIFLKAFLFLLLLFINYFIEFLYFKFFVGGEYILDIKDFHRRYTVIPNIKEDITLVSAYFNVKSKYSKTEYLNWINNFLQINHSMIFFIDNTYYEEIISKRPKEYQKKTIWVKTNITDFYSYKKFFKEFNQTHELDVEKKIYSVPIYLVWAEKINFLKIATVKNFFNSKCFYWVDAGCFRDNSKIKKYINDWPSSEKCFEDGRILLNEIIKHTKEVKDGLKEFNVELHNNFQRFHNVDPSIFGGKKKYIFKFAELYYNTIKLFVKHGIFIGKERNLFTYISYFYTDVVKLVYSGFYFYFQEYLSKDYNKTNKYYFMHII